METRFHCLTIYHAFLRRRITALTPNRDTSDTYRYYIKTFAYFTDRLLVSPFVATIYRPFPRYYPSGSALTFPRHIRLLSSSSPNTPRSSVYISHSPITWVLLECFATRAHMCIFSRLFLTTGIHLISGRSRSPTLSYSSAFSRSSLGRANTF